MNDDKKIDWIRRQLDNAAAEGEIPFSMDNDEDRERMAEWIYRNAQV